MQADMRIGLWGATRRAIAAFNSSHLYPGSFALIHCWGQFEYVSGVTQDPTTLALAKAGGQATVIAGHALSVGYASPVHIKLAKTLGVRLLVQKTLDPLGASDPEPHTSWRLASCLQTLALGDLVPSGLLVAAQYQLADTGLLFAHPDLGSAFRCCRQDKHRVLDHMRCRVNHRRALLAASVGQAVKVSARGSCKFEAFQADGVSVETAAGESVVVHPDDVRL